MKLEVVVEDLLLKTMIGIARDEYKPVLDLQENALIKRFGTRKPESVEALDTLNKASLLFSGVYQSVKSRLSTEQVFTDSIPEDFKRAYAVYVASEAVMQYLSESSAGSLQKKFHYGRPVTDFNMDLGIRDYNTIADCLEGLTKYIIGTSKPEQVKMDIVGYFRFLSGHALDKMHSPLLHHYIKEVEDVSIEGKCFQISGMKKIKQKGKKSRKKGKKESTGERVDALFQKEPKIVTLEKTIRRGDVIANEEALDAVETAVQHLLAYDTVKKMNPYMLDGGFRQFILLVGDSGTGKTLVFKYGISEAQRIAKQSNLDFLAVSLEFDDAYQDGPVQVLKYQFSSIAKDNRPYLVFIDEMEVKFSARKSLKTERHDEKTIREFLDFANGLGYPNRGNFVVLGASNLPEQIDKAIRSRFSKGTYLCEGPRTAEEKARVLYNNLLEGINQGYVAISNWREIGEVAKGLDLSGRDIAECARELIEKSRTNHFPPDFYQLNFDDKLRAVKSRHETVGDEQLAAALYAIAGKKPMLQEVSKKFQDE